MDFNGRMSVARASSNSNINSRRQQEEKDEMVLDDREIADCISAIGINFTVQDLHKPNPQLIQKIFEYFAELLMNATREVVGPAMKAAAEDFVGQDADRVYTSDTRDLMGFFVELRKLLHECGIQDFTFSDLLKPEHRRLAKTFSYIINFIRFRESQASIIDQHFNKAERTKLRIEQLYHENSNLESQLSDLQAHRKATEQALRDKERKTADLKQRLLDLKRGQERVADKLDQMKEEQKRCKAVLEERTTAMMHVKQEASKLRPYTLQKPEALEASLRELSASLTADRGQIEQLDKRARALQTSADTFVVVHQDVTACTRLLTDLASDLKTEEDELAKAARHRDALSERSNNVRDVERQERLLKKQLGNVNARTDKLRKGAEEKADAARTRMDELRGTHEELKKERNERHREMERRRVRIEQTEKKMTDLKENIENEVHAAREEYLKMESHIKLYITEMEQSI